MPVRLPALAVCMFFLLPEFTVATGDSKAFTECQPIADTTPSEQATITGEHQVPSDSTEPSFRSGPPDTTPYTRPTIPEDYAPLGKPAIPSGIDVPPPPDQTPCKQTTRLQERGAF